MNKVYSKNKDTIRTKVNKFDLFDDMFELAQASLIINALLKEQGFPLKEYKKWLIKKDQRFYSMT